jgi:hypothetical protein
MSGRRLAGYKDAFLTQMDAFLTQMSGRPEGRLCPVGQRPGSAVSA